MFVLNNSEPYQDPMSIPGDLVHIPHKLTYLNSFQGPEIKVSSYNDRNVIELQIERAPTIISGLVKTKLSWFNQSVGVCVFFFFTGKAEALH